MKRKITLIGSGLVGSLASIFLARRGYKVQAYEGRPDMRTTEISAGRSINLALANRGILPLEKAGLMDQVKPTLVKMKGRMIHDVDGTQSFLPYGQREHEVIYSVSRGGLNQTMMTAAENTGNVKIQFDTSCQSVDLENKTVTLSNNLTGETWTEDYDVLLGTDGSGSQVRKSLLKSKDSQRVKIQDEIQWLTHSYKELTIPAGQGGSFQMEKEALHIWPRGGYMLIALPNEDGSYTVTLFLPTEGNVSFESLEKKQGLQEFFETQFSDALNLIPDLPNEFQSNPTGKLGTVRCLPWYHQDHCLIFGDASHGIVPFHGQGMNAGFEDCYELDRILEENQDDWSKVLPQFQANRKPNADAIATMAVENYITMRDSVNDPIFRLKKDLGFLLEQRHPNHFIPRYSMVMFHHIPYAEAFRRGEIQDEILNELVKEIEEADEADFELAGRLITEKLEELQVG